MDYEETKTVLMGKDQEVDFMIEDIIKNISSIRTLKVSIPQQIFEDKNLVVYILQNAGDFIFLLPDELKSNRELISIGIRNKPSALLGASLDIQEDEVFVENFIDFCISKNRGTGFDFFFQLPMKIQENKEIAKKIIKNFKFPFNKFPNSIQENIDCIKLALEHSPHNIIYISPGFINDEILLNYLHSRPDLIIDKCSEKIKKDKKMIIDLLDVNTDFFKKVYHLHKDNKRIVLKYLINSNLGEIENFPSLKSDKRAIRYLLYKGLSGGNFKFLMNYKNFLNCIEYSSLVDKINYCLNTMSDNDILNAFKLGLDWEISQVKKDYLEKILNGLSVEYKEDKEDKEDSSIDKL